MFNTDTNFVPNYDNKYHIVIIVCGGGSHSQNGPILKYGLSILLKEMKLFCDISNYDNGYLYVRLTRGEEVRKMTITDILYDIIVNHEWSLISNFLIKKW